MKVTIVQLSSGYVDISDAQLESLDDWCIRDAINRLWGVNAYDAVESATFTCLKSEMSTVGILSCKDLVYFVTTSSR